MSTEVYSTADQLLDCSNIRSVFQMHSLEMGEGLKNLYEVFEVGADLFHGRFFLNVIIRNEGF